MTISPATLRAAKIKLYRQDFGAFATEQLKIKPEQGAVCPLRLDSGQLRLNAVLEKQFKERGYARVITLKGRQSGWSTLSMARGFHMASLTPNYNVLLLAVDEDSTSHVFQMAHLFYDCLDPTIKPDIKYSSKKELVFANASKKSSDPGLRSRMDFQTAKNIMAGTGTTRQALLLSEVAKWLPQYCQDLITSLLPALHPRPGTLLIEESTAYAGGDHFRDMCEKARSGKSSYGWCFSPWWFNNRNTIPLAPGEKIKIKSEERATVNLAKRGQPSDDLPGWEMQPEQIKWWRERRDEFGDLFLQEYPDSFESAWVERDEYVFNSDIMHDMSKALRTPLRYADIAAGPTIRTVRGGERPFADDDYFAIWEEPIPGVQYDIGIDVAAGISGGDWSVAEVIRRDRNEQVAEYHKHIDPVDFAVEMYWLGKYYRNAQLVVEMNNVGLITGNRLSLMAYPYIYIWRHIDRAVPSMSTYAGWKTTYESKKLLIGNTRHIFLHRRMVIRSRVLWDEMRQFIRLDENTYRASRGHDDAIMAYMMAIEGGLAESFGASSSAPASGEKPKVIFDYEQDDRPFGGGPRNAEADKMLRGIQGMR